MQFPVEVSEAVIDQASNDTASLRNLSLTCATLLPRSRYHLFSSIIIPNMKRMESSRDFFDTHPWLLPLVHKVTLFTKNPPYHHVKRNIHLLDIVPTYLLTSLPNLRAWSMVAQLTAYGLGTSLSLHRSTLAVYRKYSSHIQSLHLSGIQFYCLSDFTGLLPAFTTIHTLTCSGIKLRRKEEFDVSLYVARTGMLSRPLQVSTLTVSPRSPVGVNNAQC